MSFSENLVVTFKKGAVGKYIQFNDIRDANGTVDLSPFTITLNVRTQEGVSVIANAAVVKRDQFTNQGDAYHQLNSTTANIDAGIYRGELKVTDGTNIDYWPTDRYGNQTYFTLIVQDPLD